MNVGVVGLGFVGGAVSGYFESYGDTVYGYDIKSGLAINNEYTKIVENCEIIFVCLPTPRSDDGSCDTSIVHDALCRLDYIAGELKKSPMVLIKSTLVPGTIKKFVEESHSIRVISNPEFLTERNAAEDYRDSKTVLIGNDYGEAEDLALRLFFRDRWPAAHIYVVSSIEAELSKYLTNSYFSVKVSVANHIYALCQELGVDYNKFIESAIGADPRIERTHWTVPGPDGKLGFGGSCFPKDLSGMIHILEENNLPADVFKAAMEYNKKVRDNGS
tara:strand:+ start:72 stop:893 length:822 start_codon:yes stop_codon:yes gene_type:complete